MKRYKSKTGNDLIETNLPQYQLVANDLLQQIKTGHYPAGAKIDSVRNIALKFGVGRQVVLMALQRLASLNYIYTEPKRGVFVNPELHVGLYYRIGFYINQINPADEAALIDMANREAKLNQNWLVVGSNFEESYTFEEWLKKKSNLDGVIVSGDVTNDILKYPQNNNIPYIVLGNYDISAKHPQVKCLLRLMEKKLLSVFKKFKGKRIAAILGTSKPAVESAADIKNAIIKSGAVFDERLIINASSDGYGETVRLIETHRPDVLFQHGARKLGLHKFYSVHPDAYRPHIIIDVEDQSMNPKYSFDYEKVYIPQAQKSVVVKAVRHLLQQIQGRGIKRKGNSDA